MFKNTLFIISTPENVYLDKNISILGGLKAEIFTRMWTWSAIFKMATTGVSKMYFTGFGLQNIHLDIDIQNVCGLQADIKL